MKVVKRNNDAYTVLYISLANEHKMYTFRDHFRSSMVIPNQLRDIALRGLKEILVISILDDIDTVILIIQWRFRVR